MGAAGAGAMMGGLGQLLGGKSSSKGTSTSSSDAENQSQSASQQASQSQALNQSLNTNVSGSSNSSSNSSGNSSGSGNQAYGSLAKALAPTLGYTSGAGSMIGALLGLPVDHTNYNVAPASYMPALPKATAAPAAASSGLDPNMVSQLFAAYNAAMQSAPTPIPASAVAPPPAAYAPTAVPVPSPPSVQPGTPGATPAPPTSQYGTLPNGLPNLGASGNLAREGRIPIADRVDRREMGGPVQAGKPYVVGEKRPELFVPHTDGHIVPQVPGGSMMSGMFDHGGKIKQQGYPTQQMPGQPVATPPFMLPGANTHFPLNPAAIPATPAAHAPTPTPAAPLNPGGALDAFANSAGQQFVLNEGQRAISGQSAAGGTLQSGATGKALEQYGQNLGSTYLNDYMNHLFDYAKLGLGSASALSGAGGMSQSVGSSSGGSSGSSFGLGSGSSSGASAGSSLGTSNSSSSGTSSTDANSQTSQKAKQGLGL